MPLFVFVHHELTEPHGPGTDAQLASQGQYRLLNQASHWPVAVHSCQHTSVIHMLARHLHAPSPSWHAVLLLLSIGLYDY